MRRRCSSSMLLALGNKINKKTISRWNLNPGQKKFVRVVQNVVGSKRSVTNVKNMLDIVINMDLRSKASLISDFFTQNLKKVQELINISTKHFKCFLFLFLFF